MDVQVDGQRNEWMAKEISSWLSREMNREKCIRMNEWLDGWGDGLMNGCVQGQVDDWMDKSVDRKMSA